MRPVRQLALALLAAYVVTDVFPLASRVLG
jgi:hypothetical protein